MMSAMDRELDPLMLADLACVGLFVVVGRSSHHEGNAVVESARIAAPFAIANVAAWVLVARWRRWPGPRTVRGGIPIWLFTVSVGLVLRHTVFSRGTAMAFVIVTTLFLGVAMNGWRAVAGRRWAR